MQELNEDVRELTAQIKTLTQTLNRREKGFQRSQRLLHFVVLALSAALIAVTTLSVGGLVPDATAQVSLLPGAPAGSHLDPETRAAMKKTLLEELSESERDKIIAFEGQVKWLKQYLMTVDEGWEGPMAALMLARMADSMDVMPEMNREMEAMNASMRAVPAMVTEMRHMNANIAAINGHVAVMAAGVDSSVGRMGRMTPWMPW